MSTLSLRLPDSLHEMARQLAEEEKVSVNQLITLALAEKISALKTADYFRQRGGRASLRNVRVRDGARLQSRACGAGPVAQRPQEGPMKRASSAPPELAPVRHHGRKRDRLALALNLQRNWPAGLHEADEIHQVRVVVVLGVASSFRITSPTRRPAAALPPGVTEVTRVPATRAMPSLRRGTRLRVGGTKLAAVVDQLQRPVAQLRSCSPADTGVNWFGEDENRTYCIRSELGFGRCLLTALRSSCGWPVSPRPPVRLLAVCHRRPPSPSSNGVQPLPRPLAFAGSGRPRSLRDHDLLPARLVYDG